MISAEQLWHAVGTAIIMGFCYAHALRWTVIAIKQKRAGIDLWSTYDAGDTISWLYMSWFAVTGTTLATLLAMSVPAN